MREFAKIVVITVFILIVGTFIAAFISYILKEQQVQADSQKLQELYPNILEGASTGPEDFSVDYSSNPISYGSPLVFGGSHNPRVSHQDAWDQIAEAGVTMIRKDLFPELAIPNTTISNYKNNTNGVADPKNWNEDEVKKIKDIFINAKNRGMKTMGIMAYAPKWLTHNGTGNGVPQDWAVYEDIVKKNYAIHRDNLDYIEIWNEPDWDLFLKVQDSGYSREEVYENMFYHAAKAIREVDNEKNDGKKTMIGGPTTSDTVGSSFLEAILSSDRSREYLDFVSYHNYELKEGKHFPEPSWDEYKDVLETYNITKPFFITEWNYTAEWDRPIEQNGGSTAILYTANKLIDYLEMGLEGANYHWLEPVNISKPNEGEGYYGFYKWKNEKAELVDQARTWRIMSKQMALGKGKSTIYPIKFFDSDDIHHLGFKNVDGNYGLILTNESDQTIPVNLSLLNTNINGYAKIQIYNASTDNDAKQPLFDGLIKVEKGNTSFSYSLPSESVVGILISEEKEWFDRILLY